MIAAGVVFMWYAPLVCAADAGAPVSISPGESLGPLILKKTSEAEAVRMLGKPDAEASDEDQPGSYAYYSGEKWTGGQLVLRFDPAGVLDRVEFSSDRFRTSAGIGIDNFEAHPDEFEVVRPEPQIVPGWGIDLNADDPDIYWLQSGGLGFFQAPADKVEGMPPRVGYIAREKADKSLLYAFLRARALKKEAMANRKAEGWAKRKAYALMGDVVLVRPGAGTLAAGKGPGDHPAKHVCARYENRSTTIAGWMSLGDLQAMPSTRAGRILPGRVSERAPTGG